MLTVVFGVVLLAIFGLLYYQVVRPVQEDGLVKDDSVQNVINKSMKSVETKIPLAPTPTLQVPMKMKAHNFPYVEMAPDIASKQLDLSALSSSAASFSDTFFAMINSNRVFSPVALIHTLSIIFYASTKEAQDQILSASGGVYNFQQLQLLGKLFSRNLSYPGLMTTYLSINSMIPVEKSFKEQLKPICTVSSDNFNDSLGTMASINRHFAERTEGILTTAAKSIKLDAKGLIFNTLYWKNEWEFPFDPRKSTALNFTQVTGAKRVYRAMVGVMKTPYYADDFMQMIELNFKNGAYAMGFILPKPKENQLIPVRMNTTKLLSYLPLLKTEHYVKVLLPKFRLKRMLRMQGWLKQLGIKDIFDPRKASFPMISPPKHSFYFTDIIHEGILAVDELGANSVKQWWKNYQVQNQLGKRNLTTTPKPTKQFLANRNFLFYLRHKPSNLLLFVGDYDG